MATGRAQQLRHGGPPSEQSRNELQQRCAKLMETSRRLRQDALVVLTQAREIVELARIHHQERLKKHGRAADAHEPAPANQEVGAGSRPEQ